MASRPVLKKTFYSGELVIEVRLLEGHHVDPRKRSRQVGGCAHNHYYRVFVRARQRGAETARVAVCPPASLRKAIDAHAEMRDAARAGLSFLSKKYPVDEHAAFDRQGTGYHVGSSPKNAWPGGYRR